MTKEEALLQLGDLVKRFDDQIDIYKSGSYNEKQTRTDFIDPFFKLLGWDIDNKKGYSEAYREVIQEAKTSVMEGEDERTKAPDYAFRIGGTNIFFLEAKKPSIYIKEDEYPAYQVRRYGWSAKLPVSIVTDFEEFAVYDCTIKPSPRDKAAVARIKYLTYKEYISEFDFLWETFSRESVLKGGLEKFIKQDKGKQPKATIDREFLKSLDSWRRTLALSISHNNKQLDEDEINFAIQQIIDRIIFLRIAEDRKAEPYGQLRECIESGDYYANLYALFRTADEKYNSGLFDLKKDKISKSLVIENKDLKSVIKELYYPLCPYEFSVISVEILGMAYEQFLGKQIKISKAHHVSIEEKPEVRKAGGVYYTPQYIVDYIVKNTVGKLTENKTPKEIEKIKIVDPACGSGSFLLGAYQFLLDYHLDYYTKNKDSHRNKKDNPLTPAGTLTTAEKKKILLNNIYGVDIDPNAVEVTKLSLLLKCLEGETEASINTQIDIWHERVLPTLENNIKCGNSLIDTDYYDTQLDFGEDDKKIKPFNWEKAFPEVFKQGGFDAVIGNPPYVVLSNDNIALNYFRKNYVVVHGGKTNLYKLFIEKSFNVLKTKGILGFICPSNYLSSYDSVELRKLILFQTKIIEIIEYTEREKVFVGVTQALTTLIFQKETIATNFFNLRTSKHGFNEVEQKDFYKNKTYEFIPINKVISKMKKQKLVFSDIIEGFQGEINVSIYKDKFIEFPKVNYLPLFRGILIQNYTFTSKPNEFSPISIDKRGHFKKERIIFQEVSNQQQKRRIKATLLKENNFCGHTTNYCYVKDTRFNNLFFLGILNSKLINYYFTFFNNTNHVPIGEIKNIPFPELDSDSVGIISSLVDQLLKLNEEKQKTKLQTKINQIQSKIDYCEDRINKIVYQLYGLTEEEIKIVESST